MKSQMANANVHFPADERVARNKPRVETRIATIHPSTQQLPEMLTAKELEALLQIDRKTIYGYVQQGVIPYVRIQSNVRFRRTEILDWIEKQSYRPRRMLRAKERK